MQQQEATKEAHQVFFCLVCCRVHVQQDSALNPNVVDGKQKFGFEIGDILNITYICDDPPKGCKWMKGADGNGGKFVAKVLKQVTQ